jgi:dTDP-4-amino-4,6-dideoxygalactose transaminase
MIPFNKPHLTGKETHYIYEAVHTGKISGDGLFTKKCHQWFEERYGFQKCLLTTSCTDALEMAAILSNISPGDEVIAPSFTFVSTINAFVLRGAHIVFCDSYADHPNIDPSKIEALITSKTKAIIPMHYAGMACDMDSIMDIAQKHNLIVIEDAAQAIDSFYTNSKGEKKPLGSIGHFGTFSFHETKNIISGEGGMLAINDPQYNTRAEIIREKGTNRSQFFRGEIDKYGWVDIGSSFLPSEIIAAFLYAQIENIEVIQQKRKFIWDTYNEKFQEIKEKVILPNIPSNATNNGHMYYLVCENIEQRSALINHLRNEGVHAVFHYLSLHKSPFYEGKHKGEELVHSDKYTDCLVRLPLYYDLTEEEIEKVSDAVIAFYK